MTNPRLLEQLFFVIIMMGMYFTIQLATLEWSMMLQIKSIFVILNSENYSLHEKCQKDTQNQYVISYSLLSRINLYGIYIPLKLPDSFHTLIALHMHPSLFQYY